MLVVNVSPVILNKTLWYYSCIDFCFVSLSRMNYITWGSWGVLDKHEIMVLILFHQVLDATRVV